MARALTGWALALLVGCGSGAAVPEPVSPGTPPTAGSLSEAEPVRDAEPQEVPDQYPDGAYSVRGLRLRSDETLDREVEVIAFIVEIYQPPECDLASGASCQPTEMPHLFLGDRPGVASREDRLMLVRYGSSHEEIEEARLAAARGERRPPPPGSGLLPIPVDFAVGARVEVRGRFAHRDDRGFVSSDGLLAYGGHKILDAP